MRSFTDTASRKWVLDINVDALRRLKAVHNIVPASLGDRQFIARLYDDPIYLVDVIWTLGQDQAQKLGISDEQFGRSLGGDAIEQAIDALLGAIIDFFPKRRRDLMNQALTKIQGLQNRALAAMEKHLANDAELDAKVDRMIEQAIQEEMAGGTVGGQTSTSSQVSSASTPAP